MEADSNGPLAVGSMVSLVGLQKVLDLRPGDLSSESSLVDIEAVSRGPWCFMVSSINAIISFSPRINVMGENELHQFTLGMPPC